MMKIVAAKFATVAGLIVFVVGLVVMWKYITGQFPHPIELLASVNLMPQPTKPIWDYFDVEKPWTLLEVAFHFTMGLVIYVVLTVTGMKLFTFIANGLENGFMKPFMRQAKGESMQHGCKSTHESLIKNRALAHKPDKIHKVRSISHE